MDSQAHVSEPEGAELNAFGRLTAKLLQYGSNASHNVQDAFSRMTIQSWIRIVIIVGGYMLLRPYLMKIFNKIMTNQMEKDEKRQKDEAQAKISPNELRGEKSPLDDEDSDEGEATSTDWGSKARTRQRVMMKQLLEAEERRKQEEEEDKDIAEFLID